MSDLKRKSSHHHHQDRDRDHQSHHHHRERDTKRPSRGNEEKDTGQYEYGVKRSSGPADVKKEDDADSAVEKEKPNLATSGNLAKDTNTFNGVVIKYNEPPEARKPIKRWRLYCFKGETELPFYPMHRQSAYLFGRDRLVADIPVDHPSCSKQHAVFQYRLVEYTRKDGSTGRLIKPYIIDLSSTNGTYVNNKRVDAQRYMELREKDVLKFGFSSREYVLLHEESKGDRLLLEDEEYVEPAEVVTQEATAAAASSTTTTTTRVKQEKKSDDESSD